MSRRILLSSLALLLLSTSLLGSGLAEACAGATGPMCPMMAALERAGIEAPPCHGEEDTRPDCCQTRSGDEPAEAQQAVVAPAPMELATPVVSPSWELAEAAPRISQAAPTPRPANRSLQTLFQSFLL